MRILDLRHRLRALGASPDHESRVLRQWVNAQPQDAGKRRIEDFLPLALRNALPEITADIAALATLQSEHPGEDGSARLLVALNDGQTVESVLLPRDGLCVSTQVGCAVGCVFCMTCCARWAVRRSSRRWRWRARSASSRRSCSWAWASPRTTSTT